MEDLPIEPDSLDLLWSEGAIYNMGVAEGVRAWRHCSSVEGSSRSPT